MRNRRALSTVVGAVFFVIAATTVVAYVNYSMNSIQNFSNSVITSQTLNVDRGSEKISISSVRIDGGKFNMTVANTGSLPVHLTRLWVSNQDLATPSDIRGDLNIRIDPGRVQYNIGQSTSISASSTTSYNLKVVTERGNAATFQISPKVSTRLQIIMPSTVAPDTSFRVTTLITNNSTNPNNIVNLVPEMRINATLTKTDGSNPTNVATLLQGNTVAFTSTYVASSTTNKIIQFNASYTGAPKGSFVLSNIEVKTPLAAEKASNSQWSQAASRVAITMSGIPNPIQLSGGSSGVGKWGIGIINPLDRAVSIYAMTISTPGLTMLTNTITGLEPADANWSLVGGGSANKLLLWESGTNPLVIPAKSIVQFRATTPFIKPGGAGIFYEQLVLIQALSSEGKLHAITSVSGRDVTFSTINMFYTSNPSSPTSPSSNWGYLIKNIPSGKVNQMFNATVENSSTISFDSKVKLVVLIPGDFTGISFSAAMNSTNSAAGWGTPILTSNPDGSSVIAVETTSNFGTSSPKVFQYRVTAPAVSDTKLYVFQTTTVYPNWTIPDAVQIASAVSEAGVQVIP